MVTVGVVLVSIIVVGFLLMRKHKTFVAAMIEVERESIWRHGANFTVVREFFAAAVGREPISQEQIENTFLVRRLKQEEQCVVCLEPVSPDQEARTLQCGHSFHADCILSWWVHRPRYVVECPMCRHEQRVLEATPSAESTLGGTDPGGDGIAPQIVGAGAEPSTSV
jgi:hypothetical protein